MTALRGGRADRDAARRRRDRASSVSTHRRVTASGSTSKGPGGRVGRQADKVRAWVSYPERSTKAPVVVVIHEIFGLTDWVRAVADQLAAEGFIAIAPDLLTGHGPDGGGTPADQQAAMALVRGLDGARGDAPPVVRRRLRDRAAGRDQEVRQRRVLLGRGRELQVRRQRSRITPAPSSTTEARADAATIEKIKAPVLGLYGGSDMRVNATIPDAEAAMQKGGKSFTKHIYDGAGHGFLRQQDGMERRQR